MSSKSVVISLANKPFTYHSKCLGQWVTYIIFMNVTSVCFEIVLTGNTILHFRLKNATQEEGGGAGENPFDGACWYEPQSRHCRCA